MVILGCGEKPSFKTTVPVFPASGKIRNQGKPMTGVILLFHSTDVNQKIKSQATTDDDGKFVTTTFKTADGAPEGDYIITLVVPSNESDSTREDAATEKQFRKEGPVRFPSKYQNPTTSPLKVKVIKNQSDLGILKIN
ncbi:MAG: hypothetical protein WCN64_09985 [Planctomycetota bacterium]